MDWRFHLLIFYRIDLKIDSSCTSYQKQLVIHTNDRMNNQYSNLLFNLYWNLYFKLSPNINFTYTAYMTT